jgi:NADH-quinone oxidoreductase subunit J
MSIELALFFLLALVAIGSALGMLFSRSSVYAALYLVLNFGTVAVFYVLLNAPFIAMSQVSVYAGAIMVLFLFVIMLLGTQSVPSSEVLPWQRPLAIILAIVLAAEAGYALFTRAVISGSIPPMTETFGSPQAVGRALFNQYLLPFEITSVLLLVAMVGAIVLTRKEKGNQ